MAPESSPRSSERTYQLVKAMRNNDRAAFDAIGGEPGNWDQFAPSLQASKARQDNRVVRSAR